MPQLKAGSGVAFVKRVESMAVAWIEVAELVRKQLLEKG
jgi:hypothetical protein